jgi:hypothetical protein
MCVNLFDLYIPIMEEELYMYGSLLIVRRHYLCQSWSNIYMFDIHLYTAGQFDILQFWQLIRVCLATGLGCVQARKSKGFI